MEYESLEKMTETINSFLTLLCTLTDIIYSNNPRTSFLPSLTYSLTSKFQSSLSFLIFDFISK